jgi:UDP-N-acetyl-D-mannosaminuronic acid dehydrogenase
MDALGQQDRIELSRVSIAVFGLGKMGLPLACVLADRGANVLGVDIDPSVVEAVNAGQSPIENEPGVPALLSEHGGEGLTATTDGADAASRADVMLVLVPTVVDDNHEPILDPVRDVAADIRAGVGEGGLVVLESTVPPGTTGGEFAEVVEPDHLTAGTDFNQGSSQ